jgi:Ca-activated chloride channel homolog
MAAAARRFYSGGCALIPIFLAISAIAVFPQPAFGRVPSCEQGSAPSQSAAHILRSEVDVQTVNVQVKDKQGRNVRGLTANDFSVREDGERQQIAFFDAGTGPVTVEVLVDSSSSMVRQARLGSAEEVAARFMRIARPADEIWAMDFTAWMGHFERITEKQLSASGPMVVPRAGGRGSALYDAIASAICHLRTSTNPRQAIIVITDGIDEHSRISLDQLIELVRSQRAQLFLIGFPSRPEFRAFNHNEPKVTLVTGHDIDNPDVVFERLAKEAGAETFIPKSENGLQDALKAVSNLLESEYTLAFYPPKTSRTVQRIDVKVARSGTHILTSRFVVASPEGSNVVHFAKGSCVLSPKFYPYSYDSHVKDDAGRTVYRDDFSDPNSGWPQHLDSNYVPGGYEVSTAEPTRENPSPLMGDVGSMGETTTQVGTYRDNVVASWGPTWWNFRVSATMKALYREPFPASGSEHFSGPVQPAAGLVFRMNEKGYYALLVTSASLFKKNQLVSLSGDYKKKLAFEVVAMTFHVDPKTGGGSFVQSVVVPWIVVDHALATDARLAVQEVGDQMTIFVNGRQVGSVRDDRFTEGTVGFTAWAPARATFGNLLVDAR